MENLYGKLTASLIDNDLSFPPELADIINNNISPPEKVTADDIYVRAMYIVSDEVNSYGGRFPADEFETLIRLIIDSPVLIGHRKDSLPIARNFHAEPVRKEDANWIKVYFYWLKNARGAETLKNNIDGGIYKECSISFVFSRPECSICGDDIRRCGHRPFKEYQTADGTKSAAYFNYRQIEKVLETSIVYRGSVHDTSLTNELFFPADEQLKAGNKTNNSVPLTINRIWEIEQLDSESQHQVMPAYESLRIIVDKSDEVLTARYWDGTEIVSQNLAEYLNSLSWPDGKYRLDCRLIGYRGKERQKLSELAEHLDGRKSDLSRLEMKVYDFIDSDDNSLDLSDIVKRHSILKSMSGCVSGMLVPSEMASRDKLADTVKKYSTRYGVEIIDCLTDKKYLLTDKKRAFFDIISREQTSGRYKYHLSSKIGNSRVECITPVISGKTLPIGQSVEIEVSSIKLKDEKIELISPRIIDSINQGGANENLELLVHGRPAVKSYPAYTLSRYRSRDARLVIELNESRENYIIRNFSLNKLSQKRRFLTEKIENTRGHQGLQLGRGQVRQSDYSGLSGKIRLDGFLDGIYAIRPIVLNRTDRFLFYEIADTQTGGADNGSG